MMLRRLLLLSLAILSLAQPSHALLGAFWLGVDMKVQTTLSVDQRVLDTINALPLEVRKQAVAAANEVIEKLDQKVKEDIKLLSAEIESVSFKAAVQWECTAKAVVDKAFDDLKATLPRFTVFADACERRFAPDKARPGPIEKVKIAECWIYRALPKKPEPALIAMKLSNLELMSYDAACRLRQTASAEGMWKDNADFSLRYTVWSALVPTCRDPEDCYDRRFYEVAALVRAADPRDLGEARERLLQSKIGTPRNKCDVRCYETALVGLYLSERELKRNLQQRNDQAKILAESASAHISTALQHATKAKEAAGSLADLPQLRDHTAKAQAEISLASQTAKNALEVSKIVAAEVTSVDNGIRSAQKLLDDAALLAKATQEKEEASQRKAEEDRRRGAAERQRFERRQEDRLPK